jgi:hypothetical protein
MQTVIVERSDGVATVRLTRALISELTGTFPFIGE